MDRWKVKELKRMELGGNENARVYYEAQGMMKDGRPDHEAAPHARYKMELAAKADVVLSAELASVPQQAPVKEAQVTQISSAALSNPFDMPESKPANDT